MIYATYYPYVRPWSIESRIRPRFHVTKDVASNSSAYNKSSSTTTLTNEQASQVSQLPRNHRLESASHVESQSMAEMQLDKKPDLRTHTSYNGMPHAQPILIVERSLG
ncbi:hypothetical protein N7513_003124 [Penicillium frequentans]|nr:hypothetical protein N7513_003124 [Penicillium glabrum]